VRIYLDVSCLNRPFDDQSQMRVRLEAEATTMILERCEQGDWQQVSSQMATIEIDAMPDAERRTRVRLLLPDETFVLRLTEQIFVRARHLETLGFKRADAVHIAAAEASSVDVLLSCDDRLCRLARRRRDQLKMQVANPLTWFEENGDGTDS